MVSPFVHTVDAADSDIDDDGGDDAAADMLIRLWKRSRKRSRKRNRKRSRKRRMTTTSTVMHYVVITSVYCTPCVGRVQINVYKTSRH